MPPPARPPAADLSASTDCDALWPIYAGAVAFCLVLAASIVPARGGELLVAPALVAALSVPITRSDATWLRRLGVVVVVAWTVIAAGFTWARGANGNDTVCPSVLMSSPSGCRHVDAAEAESWNEAHRALVVAVDEFIAGLTTSQPSDAPSLVGVLAADIFTNINTFLLESTLLGNAAPSYRPLVDPSPDADSRYRRAETDAAVALIVPYDPRIPEEKRFLGLTEDSPDVAIRELRSRGFRHCPPALLPDGREVIVLVNPAVDGCPAVDRDE